MQTSPPMTLTPSKCGLKAQMLRQLMQLPQLAPFLLPKPTSRYPMSQLERMTSLVLFLRRPRFLLRPHHCNTSSCSSGRSMTSLAQYMALLLLLMFLKMLFCFLRYIDDSSLQVVRLLRDIQVFIDGLRSQQLSLVQSPPKCRQGSWEQLFISVMTLVTTQYVRSRVGSNCPVYTLLHLTTISRYFSLLPQECVCAGVSISKTTLTPIFLAYSMTYFRMSGREQVPATLPNSLSSGTESSCSGKLSWSMMCQCRTLSLLYSSERTIFLMKVSSRQCREVSIISPRHLNSGQSSISIGSPWTKWLPAAVDSNSCEKVYIPRRKPVNY